MDYETLLTELTGGVMTVTLNRPDKLNAFSTTMSRELIDFFQRVNAMDEVRAVVVTGAGRAFCAGADISGGTAAFQVWNDGNKPQKSLRVKQGPNVRPEYNKSTLKTWVQLSVHQVPLKIKLRCPGLTMLYCPLNKL